MINFHQLFGDFKIYFEQGEFEMIYTLYDKMKHFLKRKNYIADYTSVSYDKLLNYTMRLVKALENENLPRDRDAKD